ncbi:UNVERIFIED_CONTAM: hypothetical protein GTU68_065888 [Idotea baltica]|nr:hypothetical protein [Idotea baltica]
MQSLRSKELFVDATLVCEGKYYSVHRLVLSSSSSHFEELFEKTPCHHPFLIMNDTNPSDLEDLLTYIYEGKVSIAQSRLTSLIKLAETLKIKGLAIPDASLPIVQLKEDFGKSISKNRNFRSIKNRSPAGQKSFETPATLMPDTELPQNSLSPVEGGPSSENCDIALSDDSEGQSDAVLSKVDTPGNLSKSENNESEHSEEHTEDRDCFKIRIKQEKDLLQAEDNSSAMDQVSSSLTTKKRLFPTISPVPKSRRIEKKSQIRVMDMQESSFKYKGPTLKLKFKECGGLNMSKLTSKEIVDHCLDPENNIKVEVEDPAESAEIETLNLVAKAFQEEQALEEGSSNSTLANFDLSLLGSHPNPEEIMQYLISQNLLPTDSKYHNLQDTKKSYYCSFCPYKTIYKRSLLNHTKLHSDEKNFQCHICDFSAPTKWHLKRHLGCHTGDRPFKCEVCSFSSGDRWHLDRHRRVHTGEKPFKCTICNFRTSDKYTLKKHMRNQHEKQSPSHLNS